MIDLPVGNRVMRGIMCSGPYRENNPDKRNRTLKGGWLLHIIPTWSTCSDSGYITMTTLFSVLMPCMKCGDVLLSSPCWWLLSVADWKDADLMRDIEAATGEDLGSDRLGKKRKGKKKKYPNLSDLKQSANTSRSRLEKKVLNKYVTSCFWTIW